MARMPGAVWRPLPRGFGTRMDRYDLVVVHTCVGSLSGTDGYFRSGVTSANSHFGTGAYGEIWQWGDTAFRSAANAAGNHRSVTIENADMGPGFAAWNTSSAANVPAFTAAQLEANAQICAWAHKVHGVPLVAADTSRPSARGIGYHRLGCDPYRVPDGERWSSAYGKVCPGSRRIAQIPQIIARARQIVGGASTPAPEDELDATEKKMLKEVWERLATPMLREGKFTFIQEMDNIAKAAASSRDYSAAALGLLKGLDLSPEVNLTDEQVQALAAALAERLPDEQAHVFLDAMAARLGQQPPAA